MVSLGLAAITVAQSTSQTAVPQSAGALILGVHTVRTGDTDYCTVVGQQKPSFHHSDFESKTTDCLQQGSFAGICYGDGDIMFTQMSDKKSTCSTGVRRFGDVTEQHDGSTRNTDVQQCFEEMAENWEDEEADHSNLSHHQGSFDLDENSKDQSAVSVHQEQLTRSIAPSMSSCAATAFGMPGNIVDGKQQCFTSMSCPDVSTSIPEAMPIVCAGMGQTPGNLVQKAVEYCGENHSINMPDTMACGDPLLFPCSISKDGVKLVNASKGAGLQMCTSSTGSAKFIYAPPGNVIKIVSNPKTKNTGVCKRRARTNTGLVMLSLIHI